MANDPSLPKQHGALIDKDGRSTVPFRNWLNKVDATVLAAVESVTETAAAVAAIPPQTTVTGSTTIDVFGSPDSGYTVALHPGAVSAGQMGPPGRDGEDGQDSFVPGPPGRDGTIGSNGANGAAIWMVADPIEPDVWMIPGVPGPAGAAGAAGAPGGTWTTVKKTADENRNTTAVLTDDSALTIALSAATNYHIKGRIFFKTANATMDYKWAQNYTGTVTEAYQEWKVIGAAAANGTDNVTVGLVNALQGTLSVTAATFGIAFVEFDLVIVTNASGTFSFQWAQNTSDAGTISVKAGSYLEWMTC